MALYRQMFVENNNDARRECRADEYFDISIGKTPPRKEAQWFSMNPTDCIWVSISDMGRCGMYIADSSEYLTHESVDKFNIKVVPDNTVLLSFKLTVGRVAITDGAMVTNEAIAHFKTDKPEINEYLYCYLANKKPWLVAEWSERNGSISPDDVPYGSKKLYWWHGSCGHEWQASAKARSSGENCPICSNARIVAGINDLASLKPELLKEWSPSNTIQPTEIGVGSHKKVLWIGACGHEWSAEIRNRVRGAGCPYCSHNAVLQGFNDLATVLPQVAKEWSPRNAPLKPTQVTPYANRKVWWKCEQGHEWFTLISTRAYGSKCPYCSGIKLLKGFNDLASLHPQLALEWSQKNGTLLPEDFNERSTKNVWWKCSTCGHEYRAVIKSKVHGLKCPVCTKNALLPGYNDLATTDPELAQEWNAAKNTRKPTEISRLSQYPVWWKGICGHEWKDKVFHRAVGGAGCIYCEKVFLKELPYLLVTMYAKQYGLATRTDDEKMIGARIDAVIPELRLAFAFSQKGTDREAKVAEVLHFLCKAKRIQLFVIRQKDPIALATEIKQAFAKANLFINSDSQRDVAHLRKRYFAQKNNGN